MGGHRVKIAVDTNTLVRAALRDDGQQAKYADALLMEAEVVAVSTTALCEFVWVLQRLKHLARADIETALAALLSAANVRVHQPSVAAGLASYRAGGDFADGVIAYQGREMGGEVFVSFDKKAVALLENQGQSARLAG